MNRILPIVLFLIAILTPGYGQTDDSAILKTVLTQYYQTEKPVVKDRTQFLFLFCEKPNNNEQLLETVIEMKLPASVSAKIRSEIASDTNTESWNADLDLLYADDSFRLKEKIRSCVTLEEYQKERAKRNLNNQRLMIISKPILYSDGNRALVKVVFYRTIEHNNGSILHLEKINGEWIIKEYLNAWST
jgi:hypothetical protein